MLICINDNYSLLAQMAQGEDLHTINRCIFFQHSRDILIILSLEGQILEVNPAAVQAYGYSRQEFISLNVQALRAPETLDTLQAQLAEARRHGLLFETIHLRKDGSRFPVEISTQRALLDDRTVLLHIIRDISDRKVLQQLRENEARYRLMFENMSSAVAVYDVQGDGQDFIFKEFNCSGERIEQIAREAVLGQSLETIFPTMASTGLIQAFRRVWQTGQSEQYPAIFYQDKRIKGWRENYIYKLPSGEIVAIYEDVTERKQAEETLWFEKEHAQVTLESIGDAVIITDAAGNVEYLNPIAEQLTGWTKSEAKGMPLAQAFNIFSEESGKPTQAIIEKCIREGRIIEFGNHALLVHRNGHTFAIENSAAPIKDREGQIIGAVLIFHDVTDKQHLMEQLVYQANHDSLTGLPNRRYFNDYVNQALIQAQPKQGKVGIFFLDLDRFKLVNDTFGHTVGDLLLQAVALRLEFCLSAKATIARLGGDEFLILLPELIDQNQAAQIAQTIIEAFSTPFSVQHQEFFINPSIGISVYPADGADLETLIKHADAAMYHAKEQGRNNYQFYTLSLKKETADRLIMESDLRRALERQEFILYYQPQFDLSSGLICGCEVLVRWQHPERGLVPPLEFISIAEDSGLILPLGEWVLRTACAQTRHWQEMGYPSIRAAVNLSARQFRQANLVPIIAQILAENNLHPHWLELEITESIGMKNVDFTIAMFHKLKEMGIHISIDDFGTGFSSLSYLSRFPIDTLKIDQSFIKEVPQNPDGVEIVIAIINLAQTLGLKVTAEGVETPEQLSFLKKQNCDAVQGYLFSKPVPAEDFEKLFLRPKSKNPLHFHAPSARIHP